MATLFVGVASANDDDARLAAFYRAYLDETMKHSPATATRLGDHRYDSLLDDLSPPARQGAVERLQKATADLPRQVAYAKLSRGSQIDYEILEHDLKLLVVAGCPHPALRAGSARVQRVFER